jgi:hypothetical protein
VVRAGCASGRLLTSAGRGGARSGVDVSLSIHCPRTYNQQKRCPHKMTSASITLPLYHPLHLHQPSPTIPHALSPRASHLCAPQRTFPKAPEPHIPHPAHTPHPVHTPHPTPGIHYPTCTLQPAPHPSSPAPEDTTYRVGWELSSQPDDKRRRKPGVQPGPDCCPWRGFGR